MSIYFVYTLRPGSQTEQIEATYSEAEKPEAKAAAILLRARLMAQGQPSRIVSQEATNG